ncbi:MAG: hypothetical protein CL608_03560 [Anaerolineaceae bacterium]|nr:hypothetical protein [Anaerolineaceae bacterium]
MTRPRGLRTQILISFIAVIILTAVAAWFPESWLIRNEFERQTWARVEQGRRAARTLYNAWQSEVVNAAILAAQLPTLRTLLQSGSANELANYLRTVETSLDLDLVLACDAADHVVAQVGMIALENPCLLQRSVGFYIVDEPVGSPAWLLASQPVLIEGEPAGQVLVGIRLNDAFARRMRGETQLQHTLLVDGRPVATSFSAGLPARTDAIQNETRQADSDGEQITFSTTDGRSFYATRLVLENPRIADEVALSATEIMDTQRSLIRTGILSILLVVLLGTGAALIISRQISRPLLQLDEAAARLSSGDLARSIEVQTEVREVERVAATLERTRIDLQQTLATLQQEKAWVDHLLEAIVEGIMILDEDGRITYFSEGATRITGWPETQVINRLADDIFLTIGKDTLFSHLIPDSGRRRTVWVRLAEEQPAALSITRAQLVPPDAKSAQMAIVFRDVSEEEAVQRLLRNFLANITHEFRTPLTALAASVELLLDEANRLTQEELEQMLTWLHLGILGLHTLVDNLLETASLEAGRFQISPHPTDLGEIIAEAARLMQPLLKKYQQHLTVELPASTMPVVYADSRRIVQVLVNLLSNANKYGPSDSEITIRATLQDDQIKIGVLDRGPGVPSGNKTSLFHRFLHIDVESDRKRSGVGLGLWVVKAIVEEHGGEVGVTDREGGGSVFWFTLPLQEAT